MKIFKILFLLIWILSTTIFLIVFLTPLEFINKYLLFFTYLISFNGALTLRFLLTSFISFKWDKFLFGLILSLILFFSIYFFPGMNPDWQTKEILFRNRYNPETVIMHQEIEQAEGLKERRLIKLTPVTPFFNWVTEVKTVINIDETEWEKIDEEVNP